MTDVLKTAKNALDSGLITQTDYDGVKGAFLKAQQIKAGLDAGFILQQDYEQVKAAFLHSLSLGSGGSVVVNLPGSNVPVADPGMSPREPNGQALANEGSSANVAAAGQTRGAPAQELAGDAPRNRTIVPTNIPKMGGSRRKQQTGTSMSGIEVVEDAVDLYYYLKAKSVVCPLPRLGAIVELYDLCDPPRGSHAASKNTLLAHNRRLTVKCGLQYRWATWKINDEGKAVVIAEVGEKDSSYGDMLDALPANDCRYAGVTSGRYKSGGTPNPSPSTNWCMSVESQDMHVFDHQFTNSDGCVFTKIVFINWAPDAAKVKNKMMYASTKDFFKGYLDGLGVEMQANEKEDIKESDMATAVLSTITRS